ncbi:ABC transporter family substrate-binding protein [Gephyromycinifex aptenodytis]|uniref:ABC transporter family substrate-binding protein n=1 Tax=Gephyromycinifex aptenodytis TaxID=2716227 RepID=UPI001445D00E|nr:ABC transporter family substrate-binding protein [Gephyromycinifex aptenodytis]
MKSRTTNLALAACMSAALVLSGCASGGDSGEGGSGGGGNATGAAQDGSDIAATNAQDRSALEEGGVFTRDISDWTTNFNGWHVDGNLAEYNRVLDATDPILYNWSADGEMSPRTEFLTEMPKVEEKDGKQVITFKMNPKAKWNDDTPIDYTAFEATWKAHAQTVDKGGYNNVATTGYENIESVVQGETPNEVVVTMKTPYYPPTEFFQGLIHPKLGASPKAFNELMKTEFHPELRSGPFTLDTIDQQSKTIVLKPNDKWWGEKPLLSKIVFRQMEDSATIPAFKNGEIDATRVGNKARLAQVKGATDLEVRTAPRLTTNVFLFNAKADSLKDINVRKAIWQSINREEIKQVRFNGMDWKEKPANSALYFNFQPETADNMPVEFSPEDAKKTLKDAGYTEGSDGIFAKDGKKVSVKYTTFGDDPMTTALAQTVQKQVKAGGIDLALDIRPAAAFGPTMEKRDFGFLAMGWSSNSSSPLTSVCQTMCSDSGSNYSTVGTPELDKRMKALGGIEDQAEQTAEMNAIEKEWLQLYGQMPLFNGPEMWAVRKGLANWGPAAFGSMHPQWENVGWVKGSSHK